MFGFVKMTVDMIVNILSTDVFGVLTVVKLASIFLIGLPYKTYNIYCITVIT